jgi:predicted aspartyl protease
LNLAPPPTRRKFLRRLIVIGAGVAGYFVVREQLLWPTPKVVFAGGDSSGWMDLPLAGGLIDVPARIGGSMIRAVVDSGAQYSAIDAALAQKLALPAATPIPMVAFGVSGSPSLTRAVTLDADLGAFGLKGLRAATLDLQGLTGMTRQPFSLLLGRDFLRAVTAEVDFPAGRAAFFAPGAWRAPAGARAADVSSRAGGLMVAVRIEGGPPLEVMLDTGATGALALSERAARDSGLFDGRPLRTGQSVTLGGVSEDGVTLAREVLFAGSRLADVEVEIYHPATSAPVPNGLLGLGVLQRFHLALDVAAAKLFLIGPEAGPPAPRGHRERFRVIPAPPIVSDPGTS